MSTKPQSEVTKSQSEITKSQSEVTKSQSEVTKSQSEATKSQSEATKSQSEVTKSQSEVTKPQITKSPAMSTESEIPPVLLDSDSDSDIPSTLLKSQFSHASLHPLPGPYLPDSLSPPQCKTYKGKSDPLILAKPPRNAKYKCQQCDLSFEHSSQIQDHISRMSRRKLHCPECGEEFVKVYKLQNHMSDRHGFATWKKQLHNICNQTYQYALHTRQNAITKQYLCFICKSESFNILHQLQDHIKIVHLKIPLKRLKCSLCSFTCTKFELLDKHSQEPHAKRVKKGEDQVRADEQKPKQQLSAPKKLRKIYPKIEVPSTRVQILGSTSESVNTCFVCGEVFGGKSELTNHLRCGVHWEVSLPFFCVHCGDFYHYLDSMQSHCYEAHGDGTRLSYQSLPLRNILIDRAFLLKYPCKYCRLTFRTGEEYQAHLEENHPNPFLCAEPKCGFSCERSKTMECHMQVLHGKSTLHGPVFLHSVPLETLYKPSTQSCIQDETVSSKSESVKTESSEVIELVKPESPEVIELEPSEVIGSVKPEPTEVIELEPSEVIEIVKPEPSEIIQIFKTEPSEIIEIGKTELIDQSDFEFVDCTLVSENTETNEDPLMVRECSFVRDSCSPVSIKSDPESLSSSPEPIIPEPTRGSDFSNAPEPMSIPCDVPNIPPSESQTNPLDLAQTGSSRNLDSPALNTDGTLVCFTIKQEREQYDIKEEAVEYIANETTCVHEQSTNDEITTSSDLVDAIKREASELTGDEAPIPIPMLADLQVTSEQMDLEISEQNSPEPDYGPITSPADEGTSEQMDLEIFDEDSPAVNDTENMESIPNPVASDEVQISSDNSDLGILERDSPEPNNMDSIQNFRSTDGIQCTSKTTKSPNLELEASTDLDPIPIESASVTDNPEPPKTSKVTESQSLERETSEPVNTPQSLEISDEVPTTSKLTDSEILKRQREQIKEVELKVSQTVQNPKFGFPCYLCPKFLEKSTSLRDHVLQIHLRIKELKCYYCDQQFFNKLHVIKLHQNNQHRNLPFRFVRRFEPRNVSDESEAGIRAITRSGAAMKRTGKEAVGPQSTKVRKLEEAKKLPRSAKVDNTAVTAKRSDTEVEKTTQTQIDEACAKVTEVVQSKSGFKCYLCPSYLTRRNALKSHILVHHLGIKQFKCRYCEKIFLRAHKAREHLAKVHPELPSLVVQRFNVPSFSHTVKPSKNRYEGCVFPFPVGRARNNRATEPKATDKKLSHKEKLLAKQKEAEDLKREKLQVKEIELKIQETIEDPKFGFKCYICSMFLSRRNILRSHLMVQHFEIQEYECNYCECKLFGPYDVKRHHNREHKNSSLEFVRRFVIPRNTSRKSDFLSMKIAEEQSKKKVGPGKIPENETELNNSPPCTKTQESNEVNENPCSSKRLGMKSQTEKMDELGKTSQDETKEKESCRQVSGNTRANKKSKLTEAQILENEREQIEEEEVLIDQVVGTPDFKCYRCSSISTMKKSLRRHVLQHHLHIRHLKCKHCSVQFYRADVARRHCARAHPNLPVLIVRRFDMNKWTDRRGTVDQVEKNISQDHTEANVSKTRSGAEKTGTPQKSSELNKPWRVIDSPEVEVTKPTEAKEPPKITKPMVEVKKLSEIKNPPKPTTSSEGKKQLGSSKSGKSETWKFELEMANDAKKQMQDAEMRINKVIHNPTLGFQCYLCFNFLYSRYTLRNHVLMHHLKIKQYKCRYCEKKFYKKESAKRHHLVLHPKLPLVYIRTFHVPNFTPDNPKPDIVLVKEFEIPKPKVVNPNQPKSKKTPSKPRKETPQETEVEILERKTLIEDTELKLSKVSETPGSGFQCYICSKFVKRRFILKHHILFSHLQIRQFECKYCDSEFYRKFEVRKHHATAHPNSPLIFVRKFQNQKELKAKKNSSKKVECPGKKSPVKKTLKSADLESLRRDQERINQVDLRINDIFRTARRGFRCYLCPKHLCTRFTLKRHVLIQHLRIKMFQCAHCSEQFFESKNARTHHAQAHPGLSQGLVRRFGQDTGEQEDQTGARRATLHARTHHAQAHPGLSQGLVRRFGQDTGEQEDQTGARRATLHHMGIPEPCSTLTPPGASQPPAPSSLAHGAEDFPSGGTERRVSCRPYPDSLPPVPGGCLPCSVQL